MAQDKKSFILYVDLIHTVDALEDVEAGRLFKHVLRYVNDLNPTTEDRITQITFEPIKQQLKRDLISWEKKRGKLSDSGREGGLKSAEARRSKSKQPEAKRSEASNSEPNASKTQANEAVTVNVTVNDNVNVTVTQKQNAFESLKKYYGFDSEVKHINKWQQINSFLTLLITKGNFSAFENQFEYYKKYKEASGEKIHGFLSFIEGAWDSENWEHKYNNHKTPKKELKGKQISKDEVYKKPGE